MEMYAVIATHGRPVLLERTLLSLAQTRLPGAFRQCLVIENGSDAGAQILCREMKDKLPIQYHNLGAPGKSRALQWAIDHVVGNALAVFFDDDIRVDPGILQTYATAAEENGPEMIYGGPMGVDYDVPPEEWLLPYLPLSAKGWEGNESADEIVARGGFFGCNYAVFAEKIRGIGGFNPDLGPGAIVSGTEGNPVGQETEFQRRAFSAGMKPLFLPDARVWHYVPAERCSQAWAIQRNYRICLSRSKSNRDSTRPVKRILGIPVGNVPLIKRFHPKIFFAEHLSFLIPNRKLRFRMRYWAAGSRGYLEGERNPAPQLRNSFMVSTGK